MLNAVKSRIAIFTILMQSFILILITASIFLSQNISSIRAILPFWNIVILILSGLVILSIKQIEENSRKEMETRLLKEHLQHVENLVNSLNIQRHEHTRHLQTLQAMLCLEEIAQAVEYLDGVADNYVDMQDLIYVGNPALTALLNSRRKVAEVKNIDFEFAIKCDTSKIAIAPWDLCSIVGNLLDNAMEAVMEEDSNRRVNMEIKYESNSYVIYVFNNGPKIKDDMKDKLFQPGFTTRDSEGRGFGLYLVHKLVQKYGGIITLVNEPRTTFIVSIPDGKEERDAKNTVKPNRRNHRLTAAK